VKSLSGKNPVPLGTNLDGLFGDFFVICRNVSADVPECFVLTPAEVRKLAHKGEKDGKITYWLQPKQYAIARFSEQWKRVGVGSSEALPPAGGAPVTSNVRRRAQCKSGDFGVMARRYTTLRRDRFSPRG